MFTRPYLDGFYDFKDEYLAITDLAGPYRLHNLVT